MPQTKSASLLICKVHINLMTGTKQVKGRFLRSDFEFFVFGSNFCRSKIMNHFCALLDDKSVLQGGKVSTRTLRGRCVARISNLSCDELRQRGALPRNSSQFLSRDTNTLLGHKNFWLQSMPCCRNFTH